MKLGGKFQKTLNSDKMENNYPRTYEEYEKRVFELFLENSDDIGISNEVIKR